MGLKDINLECVIEGLEFQIKIGKQSPKLFAELGFCYYKSGRTKEAILILEEARKKKQTNEDTYFGLGTCYRDSGRMIEAFKIWEEARAEDKANTETFVSLAAYYHQLNDTKKELEVLEEARSKNKVNKDIFKNLAIHYLKTGETDKLIIILEEAINKNQANADMFSRLGVYYYNSKRNKDAQRVVKKAVNSGQTNAITHFLFALLNKDKDYASNLLKIIEKKDNRDYYAYVLLHNYLSERNDKKFIKELSRKVIMMEMVDTMRRNGEFTVMISDYMKASHKIKVIDDPILGSSIIVKEGRSSFSKERKIRDILEEIVDDEVSLPVDLWHFKEGSKFYYTMARENGETLTERINQKSVSEDTYDSIINIIAKIHVLFPLNVLGFDYKYKSKIEKAAKRLQEKMLIENLIGDVVKNYGPIIEVLSHSKTLCYNKDSSPENWMINEDGKVILIDTEDKGVVPYALDIATFLNFKPFLPFEKRFEKVEKYIKEVNKICEENNRPKRRIEDIEQFMNEYCNAVIYRALVGSPYLISLGRKEDEKLVRQAGVKMIKHMKKNRMIIPEHENDYNQIKLFLETKIHEPIKE